MTKEEKQVEAKLEELQFQVSCNERLMRKAFFKYEELLSVKACLVADIQALREFRESKIRNSVNHNGQLKSGTIETFAAQLRS